MGFAGGAPVADATAALTSRNRSGRPPGLNACSARPAARLSRPGPVEGSGPSLWWLQRPPAAERTAPLAPAQVHPVPPPPTRRRDPALSGLKKQQAALRRPWRAGGRWRRARPTRGPPARPARCCPGGRCPCARAGAPDGVFAGRRRCAKDRPVPGQRGRQGSTEGRGAAVHIDPGHERPPRPSTTRNGICDHGFRHPGAGLRGRSHGEHFVLGGRLDRWAGPIVLRVVHQLLSVEPGKPVPVAVLCS